MVLDVTSDESVAAFATSLAGVVNAPGADRSLYAVVNNAGVASGGAVDWLKLTDFMMDMEVGRFQRHDSARGLLQLSSIAFNSSRSNRVDDARRALFNPRYR